MTSPPWPFGLQWIVANTVGWTLAMLLEVRLGNYNHFSNQDAAYVIGGACVGAAIGLLSSVPLVRLVGKRI